MSLLLKSIPFAPQSRKSANCGPCTVKMVLDYYKITHPLSGEAYGVHSLNRLLKVTKAYGTQESDIKDFFRTCGLQMRRIPLDLVEEKLQQGRPLLSVFVDELGEGHFALIIGLKKLAQKITLIFHDPWPDFGPYFERELTTFRRQMRPFGRWVYEIYPQNISVSAVDEQQ